MTELVGGPLDGLQVAAPSGPYAWVDAKGRVSAQEAADKALYRRVPLIRAGVPVMLWSGDTVAACAGCGGLHERRDRAGCAVASCCVCGADLQAARPFTCG